MIYQLPNGKVIHITVEEYLDLTDQDIQYFMSINAGDYATSPFYGSAISKNKPKIDDFDKSIDYEREDEDKNGHVVLGEDEIYLDDLPDMPDMDQELD